MKKMVFAFLIITTMFLIIPFTIFAKTTQQTFIILINDEEVELSPEYKSFNVDDHIYVPLRFIAEKLNNDVSYHSDRKTITITPKPEIELKDKTYQSNIYDQSTFEDFHLSIRSTSNKVSKNEELPIFAEFEYKGKENVVLNNNGDTDIIKFYISDSSGNRFQKPNLAAIVEIELTENTKILAFVPDTLLAMYHIENNNMDLDDFNNKKALPPLKEGNYKIGAYVDFTTIDGNHVEMSVEIDIEVV